MWCSGCQHYKMLMWEISLSVMVNQRPCRWCYCKEFLQFIDDDDLKAAPSKFHLLLDKAIGVGKTLVNFCSKHDKTQEGHVAELYLKQITSGHFFARTAENCQIYKTVAFNKQFCLGQSYSKSVSLTSFEYIIQITYQTAE